MRKTYNRNKANLGKQLERLLDMAHNQYRNKGVADIRKVPTPVQITGNNRGNIKGYVTKGEWVDYVGVFNGKAIVFDAKETNSATSFPLRNVSDHQYQLLKSWDAKGAVAFLIIQFTKKYEEIYIIRFSDLEEWWEQSLAGGRKSIPYNHFFEKCRRVKSSNGIVLDYLQGIGGEAE